MTPACDLCASPSLSQVYAAPDSTRKLTVWVCGHCGLAQSLPRIDRAERRAATVSAGADWGNLRYGKGFRAEANFATLKPYLKADKPLRVLDVGTNRGAFALKLLEAFPNAMITGIEPDERVVDAWARKPSVTRVLVAGGFSGHGFKFAPAIGGLVAGVVLDGERAPALEAFARARHLA